MPKNKSKAQQRKMFALASRGVITKSEAKKRAVKGKAFKKLPARKKR